MAVAVGTGGWQIRPVLSGSMRPGLPIGGVVVTEREPLAELQVRDVAVFHPPGQPNIDYVHRVVSLTRSDGAVVVHTQGDANLYPDPWTLRLHGRWAYIAQFTVPLVGYPAVWVHSPQGRTDMLLVAAFLALVLIGSLAGDLRRRRRRVPDMAVGAVAPTDSTTPITVRGLGTPTERSETISR
jgi:signal peptidase